MEKIQEQDGGRGRAKAAGLAVNIWRSGPDVQGEIAASLLQDLLPPVSSRLHHGDNLMRAATRGQIHFGFVNPLVGINGQITCFPSHEQTSTRCRVTSCCATISPPSLMQIWRMTSAPEPDGALLETKLVPHLHRPRMIQK